MLTCTCGNMLISNGFVWQCPLSGKTTMSVDKGDVHKGVIIVDKRVSRDKRPVA
jgi:hypothetical protein